MREEHVKLSTPARAAKSEEKRSDVVDGVEISVRDLLTQFAEFLISELAESSDFWGTAMISDHSDL